MSKLFSKKVIWLVLILVCVLFILGFFLAQGLSLRKGATLENRTSFVFTAAGDYGANSTTIKNLKNVSKQSPELHFVLGDFSLNQVSPEVKWCKFVKKYLFNVPVMLLAGNHESNGRDGLLENFISCLPNEIPGVEGDYGKEYYFDYPKEEPIVRFIMISPDLTFSDGTTFAYSGSSENFKWLKETIEDGKEKEIPWTIVGMHKTCIAAGDKICEVGEELIDYLLANNVDLILQGHVHAYQRTKQLVCVQTDLFDPNCLGHKNESEKYKQGNGGIIAIVGTGGYKPRQIGFDDVETPYFASLVGDTYGFLRFELNDRELKASFHSAAGVKDEFIIER